MALTMSIVQGMALSAGGAEASTVADPAPPADHGVGTDLAVILARKIDVLYRRAFPAEVLADLEQRTGMHVGCPPALERQFLFTLEQQQVTVAQVLDAMAAQGALVVDCHGDQVALWKAADDARVSGLATVLASGGTEQRCEAVADLAMLGDKRIYPLLKRALGDSQAAVAATAILALDRHRGAMFAGVAASDWVEPLLTQLAAARMTRLRPELMRLLGMTRDARAVEPLIAMVRDSDLGTQGQAALALGATRDTRAVAPLEALVKQDLRNTAAPAEARVRDSAIYGLGDSRDPHAVEALIVLSKENQDFYPDRHLQESVAYALGLSRSSAAFAALIALSANQNHSVRMAATAAFGRTRDPAALKPLGELWRHWDDGMRERDDAALVELGDSAASGFTKDWTAPMPASASGARSPWRPCTMDGAGRCWPRRWGIPNPPTASTPRCPWRPCSTPAQSMRSSSACATPAISINELPRSPWVACAIPPRSRR